MCLGLLANHLFSLNFIFTSGGFLAAARNERHVLRMYAPTSWSHSAAMDGH
jgi:hypothetical protein